MSWRKHKTHREETKAVKEALSKAGFKARVGHGSGTAWGWLEIYPIGKWGTSTRGKVLRLIQQVTGRHGDYDGEIIINY